ncbi:MAG: hypothetical protein C4531_10970 [Desulfurivibrio sp.]|nr:MAG: hypothetical protein C4531_10970 [Desulfurivibrio sp.]
MRKTLITVIIPALLLAGLPLLGILAAEKNVSQYWEFPPLTRYVAHAPFCWPLFTALVLLGLLVAGLFLVQMGRGTANAPVMTTGGKWSLPWWGWLGLGLLTAGWVLAWNRFPWFAGLQPHTFLPLWLGFILVVNGLTRMRTGSCLLSSRTGFFAALFPLSVVFWWFFEYLNRFVQNWYYVGVEDFSPLAYVIHASLCFATVLPAVLSTEELLASFPRLSGPLAASWPVTCRGGKYPAFALFVLSSLGLAGIGLRPDYLFPLLWLSPLLLVITLQKLTGRATMLAPLGRGDWRPVWLPALAALCCGFFWELWNFNSQAHWEYSIPFVQKFHIFAMPAAGYLGYLPFGLECRAAGALLAEYLEGGNG